MSSVIPHHTLIEKRRWKFVSIVPCGISWDHRCELLVLLIPLRVKIASSVNSIGSNWRLVCNQWQNSRRMALSPGCRFCTGCGGNRYKPSSCNVRHTHVRETTIHAESLRVLVVGYAVPYQERFPVPPCFIYVLVQMKHEHWDAYRIHAMYCTPCKTLFDPEFCA